MPHLEVGKLTKRSDYLWGFFKSEKWWEGLIPPGLLSVQIRPPLLENGFCCKLSERKTPIMHLVRPCVNLKSCFERTSPQVLLSLLRCCDLFSSHLWETFSLISYPETKSISLPPKIVEDNLFEQNLDVNIGQLKKKKTQAENKSGKMERGYKTAKAAILKTMSIDFEARAPSETLDLMIQNVPRF